jgi:hypothetical protein
VKINSKAILVFSSLGNFSLVVVGSGLMAVVRLCSGLVWEVTVRVFLSFVSNVCSPADALQNLRCLKQACL